MPQEHNLDPHSHSCPACEAIWTCGALDCDGQEEEKTCGDCETQGFVGSGEELDDE